MADVLRAGSYPLLAALAHNEAVYKGRDSWPLEQVGQKSIRKSDIGRVRKLVSVRLRAWRHCLCVPGVVARKQVHTGHGAS